MVAGSSTAKPTINRLLRITFRQGCQIFRCTIYQNGENVPNEHEIYQSAIKYTRWPENIPNIPAFSIARPSKIYPNWDFGLKINHLATLLSEPVVVGVGGFGWLDRLLNFELALRNRFITLNGSFWTHSFLENDQLCICR
jgi:hypothetical protein